MANPIHGMAVPFSNSVRTAGTDSSIYLTMQFAIYLYTILLYTFRGVSFSSCGFAWVGHVWPTFLVPYQIILRKRKKNEKKNPKTLLRLKKQLMLTEMSEKHLEITCKCGERTLKVYKSSKSFICAAIVPWEHVASAASLSKLALGS